MEAESIGKALPRMLLPYAYRWADRSGLTLLSQMLADDHFLAWVEKYGEELASKLAARLAARMAARTDRTKSHAPANGNGRGHVRSTVSRAAPRAADVPRTDDADAGAGGGGGDLSDLLARVHAMEERLEAQHAGFEALHLAMRPLALALGCCPDCLVGVDGCTTCGGRGKVACYEPDRTLLVAEVINPLAARGVPIALSDRTRTHQKPRSKLCRKK